MGMNVDAQKNIRVHYANYEVGDYYADLIVNDLIILELKAAEAICEEHEAQLVNYLKATNRSESFIEFWEETGIQKESIYEFK